MIQSSQGANGSQTIPAPAAGTLFFLKNVYELETV